MLNKYDQLPRRIIGLLYLNAIRGFESSGTETYAKVIFEGLGAKPLHVGPFFHIINNFGSVP